MVEFWVLFLLHHKMSHMLEFLPILMINKKISTNQKNVKSIILFIFLSFISALNSYRWTTQCTQFYCITSPSLVLILEIEKGAYICFVPTLFHAISWTSRGGKTFLGFDEVWLHWPWTHFLYIGERGSKFINIHIMILCTLGLAYFIYKLFLRIKKNIHIMMHRSM